MVTFMKDSGLTTKEKVKENFLGKMEIFIMDNGFKIKKMVMENIIELMVILTKVLIIK